MFSTYPISAAAFAEDREDRVVAVSGVGASALLGAEDVTATALVYLTGVVGPSYLGSEVVVADANVSVSGLSATTALGNESVTATAVVLPTGVVGTSALGAETVTADANLTVTGVSGAAYLGAEDVEADADVLPTGVAATASVTSVSGVIGDANFAITGVAGAAYLGNEDATADAVVQPAGVQGTTGLSSPTVWGLIPEDPSVVWTKTNVVLLSDWDTIDPDSTTFNDPLTGFSEVAMSTQTERTKTGVLTVTWTKIAA